MDSLCRTYQRSTACGIRSSGTAAGAFPNLCAKQLILQVGMVKENRWDCCFYLHECLNYLHERCCYYLHDKSDRLLLLGIYLRRVRSRSGRRRVPRRRRCALPDPAGRPGLPEFRSEG